MTAIFLINLVYHKDLLVKKTISRSIYSYIQYMQIYNVLYCILIMFTYTVVKFQQIQNCQMLTTRNSMALIVII